MKEIPLTKGMVAIVDDEDYAELSKYKWHYSGKYARRYASVNGKRIYVWMHRVIAGTPDGMDTDHINGNKLDNRRANLRVCTRSQNMHNSATGIKNNTSKYKGVTYNGGKWIASICVNFRKLYLGCFTDERDAATAYNEAAFRLMGDFAQLNTIDQWHGVPLPLKKPAVHVGRRREGRDAEG
jgi:hypothetical protein